MEPYAGGMWPASRLLSAAFGRPLSSLPPDLRTTGIPRGELEVAGIALLESGKDDHDAAEMRWDLGIWYTGIILQALQ